MSNGTGENRLRTIRRRAVAVDRDRAAHPAPLVGNTRAYRKAPTKHGFALYSHEASVAREIRRHGHIDLLGAVSARIAFHPGHDRTSAIVRLDPRQSAASNRGGTGGQHDLRRIGGGAHRREETA